MHATTRREALRRTAIAPTHSLGCGKAMDPAFAGMTDWRGPSTISRSGLPVPAGVVRCDVMTDLASPRRASQPAARRVRLRTLILIRWIARRRQARRC